VSEGEWNLRQRIQEQAVWSARDFYGDSLGRFKGRLQGDCAQLEDLAEQLPEGDAQAQIRDMVDSYSKIEGSIDRAAHDFGVEDAMNETARQAQQEAGGESGQTTQGAQDAAGGTVDRATGVVGQVTSQAGQIAEDAQETLGQALDQVGQVAENLPGGQLLSRTTNEAGQTVQRAVDESGDIIEITLDEAGNLVNEKLVGSLTDLPAEEEYQNEEGQTIRIVKEEFGTLIELQLSEDGSILDLQIPPSSKT
jgi:hypothetical protein